MLTDFERKLLRILYNYSSAHRRMPTLLELECKTGRTAAVIHNGLAGLMKQKYIEWPDRPYMGTIEILAVLEGEWRVHFKSKAKSSSHSIDYWTQY